MSNVSESPSLMPSVSAIPSSIDSSALPSANQRPAVIRLCDGAAAI